MKNSLKEEITKFREWAQYLPEDKKVREWETDYPFWSEIYRELEKYLLENVPEMATDEEYK